MFLNYELKERLRVLADELEAAGMNLSYGELVTLIKAQERIARRREESCVNQDGQRKAKKSRSQA
jgi:hypothetical protein